MNAWPNKATDFAIVVSAVVLFLVPALIAAHMLWPTPALSAKPEQIAGPVLKIITDKGHGSGVHIGDGFILSATHVVKDAKEIKAKTDAGELVKTELLWSNETYDIALLRAADHAGFASAPLSCRTAVAGESIQADGNPGPMEFVSVWGKIGGNVRTIGPWREALVTNIVTVPGQSGGPVFDASGDIIGITVGVMAVPMGLAGSFVGIGYVVPSSSACMLMGRS